MASPTGKDGSYKAVHGFANLPKEYAYGAWDMYQQTQRKWFARLVYKGEFVIQAHSPSKQQLLNAASLRMCGIEPSAPCRLKSNNQPQSPNT